MTTDTETTSEISPKTKKWMIIALILAAVGFAISIYSTSHHIQLKEAGFTDAACNINETFSCDDVAKSKYSEVLGVPLGVFGLGYFLALAVLALIAIFSREQRKVHVQTYGIMVEIGVVTALVLGGISAFDLGAFCVTCIGIYVVNFIQAGVFFAFKSEFPSGVSIKNLFSGGTTALIAVAFVVGIYNFAAPSLKSSTNSEVHKGTDKKIPLLAEEKSEITIYKSPYSGLGEDYRAGSDSAKVVIVEFADFECPACRNMAQIMKTIKKEYGDQILMVFKNYPLDQSCNPSIKREFHKSACDIAVLSRCAGNFGKFWQYHDKAYAEQKSASKSQAKLWAKEVGLTDDQISTCLADKSIIEKLRDDINVAEQVGLTGTPTLFINGRKLLGNKGLVDIRAEIDKILAVN